VRIKQLLFVIGVLAGAAIAQIDTAASPVSWPTSRAASSVTQRWRL